MKNKNRFLWISVAVALATVTLVIFLIPTGSRVHVVAEVEDNSVAIKSCALKKIFAINVLDPENTISTGNRAIYMRIFYNQTEILETERCSRNAIGVGDCVLDSAALPSNLEINSLLSVKIELCDQAGQVLAEDETTIVYK